MQPGSEGSATKVSIFVTCLIDQLFPQVGLCAVKVLEELGVTVHFDPRQTCCGQPAFNTGYQEEARQVARHFLNVFSDTEYIVVPSGSCASMVKVFIPGLFEAGSSEHRLAETVASRTWEFSEFLVRVLQVRATKARFRARVTYHDSCHLLRELGIAEAPRLLIRAVKGVELVEMEHSDRCCGFGGTFSVKYPEISTSMGMDKIRSIQATGAEYVIANDVSCLMHLQGLLNRHRLPIGIMHLAELLAHFPSGGDLENGN